jgi:regulatory protein
MDRPLDTENNKKPTDEFAGAKIKIAKYCAYQERAHIEVEQKLYSLGITSTKVQELLAWLITENYVNEERYATAFAGGKFRIKKWGKLKISRHLEQKKVSQYNIDKALSLIDDKEYLNIQEQLIRQKWKNTTAGNVYELRNKVARYVMGKGFEPDQVWELTKTIIT